MLAWGSCQGLGVELGDGLPQSGYLWGQPDGLSSLLPWWKPRVRPPALGSGGGGIGDRCAGLLVHQLDSVPGSKEQVTGRRCEWEALGAEPPCIWAEGSGALPWPLPIRARERPSSRADPRLRGLRILGSLHHQKLMSLTPQRCEGRAGVRDGRPGDQRGRFRRPTGSLE